MKEDKRRFSSVLRDNAIHRMYEEERRKAGGVAIGGFFLLLAAIVAYIVYRSRRK